jgi:hypothetical protein
MARATRIRRKAQSISTQDLQRARDLSDQISALDGYISREQEERKNAFAELTKIMEQHKLDTVEGAHSVTKKVTKPGRSTTEVDVRKLFKMLKQTDFFACVKPVLKQMQTVMTGKQIEEVSTVIPGKSSTAFVTEPKE